MNFLLHKVYILNKDPLVTHNICYNVTHLQDVVNVLCNRVRARFLSRQRLEAMLLQLEKQHGIVWEAYQTAEDFVLVPLPYSFYICHFTPMLAILQNEIDLKPYYYEPNWWIFNPADIEPIDAYHIVNLLNDTDETISYYVPQVHKDRIKMVTCRRE